MAHCDLHTNMVFMSNVTCGNLEFWATSMGFLLVVDQYGNASSKLLLWVLAQLSDMC
jgi:hypothetical protein